MKSKRSKACDIPKKVKEIVYERDNHHCIILGCKNKGFPNAHYIRRSQGGLGIEQNVVTLCIQHHQDYDNGNSREKIGNYIAEYLKSNYGQNWNEQDLIYNKWRKND